MSKFPLNDDGELPFETDVEKPKKRPFSRWWRKTYIPIPLLLALCLLLICSAVLLLSSSFANGSLLCRIPSFCSDKTAADLLALIGRDPRPPFNAPHLQHRAVYDSKTDSYTYFDVTVTPDHYTAPRCDPNGDYRNYLMFTAGASDNTEIFIISADGTGLCRVTDNLIEERQVDWSPDRKRITFMSQRSGDGATDIYVMNFDGTNITNLSQDQRDDFSPVWSPDGTQVAFSSQDPSGPGGQIDVINADGSNKRNLTPGAALTRLPSWSPDGTQIAYAAGTMLEPNLAEIYTVKVNTDVIRQLTNGGLAKDKPFWMPDASGMIVQAYTASEPGQSGTPSLVTLNMKDESLEAFTEIPYLIDGLAFSPDQSSIAYVTNYDLYILDTKSMKTRSLAPGYRLILSTVSWR